MSFDKFKNIGMPDIDVSVDSDYVKKLDSLPEKKHKKQILPIIGTVAAAVLVVVGVSLWALIGRGVRGGMEKPTAAPTDDEEYSVTVRCEIVEAEMHSKIENEEILNYSIYFGINGEDAAALIKILEALEGFDENAICKCASAYGVSFNGKTYGLRLGPDQYARYGGGQVSLSYDTAKKITDIFERQLVMENRIYPEAGETELMLTLRDGNTISRYVFKDENSEILFRLALSADYQQGVVPYDAEYKLGMKNISPVRFALSLKGDAPFIAGEKGIYYLDKDEADMLKKAIDNGAVEKNKIKAEPSYEAPYQARAVVKAYPDDGGDKYSFYNADSDELLLLLESYYYQDIKGGCACPLSVQIIPTHLRNEYPRSNCYYVAFCEDSTHVYLEGGSRHAVVSYQDGIRIKEILYKNCTEPYVVETENQ